MTGIFVYTERCNGCGACVEVCPNGALYLVDGKATVDNTLCRDCEACIAVCPTEALLLTEQRRTPTAEPVQVPAVRPEPEIIRVRAQPSSLPLRARVLPAVGAALVWAGREIMPRLVDYALESLDRRTSQQAKAVQSNGSASRGGGRGGQQHRHRRRGA